jgi:Flp pilus assembly protein TadG
MFAKQSAEKRPGFLMRLRQDQTGNAIMLMAFGLIPLTGMIGSGIDISRVYLVKARLQQACDAGALAGRKRMGSSTWSTATNTVANNMFNANFAAGTSSSEGLTKSYTEAGGIVRGTASVDLPMVVMKIFGNEETSISVECEAQLAVPNTDVMFVLDTTGSMNWADDGTNNTTNVEITKSKIRGMRTAVRCFYEALSKQNSVADCGSVPSGQTQTAQTRFGFVPYALNVNVGDLLPNAYMKDSHTYQSRQAVLTPVWAYTLGAVSNISYGAYNNPTAPTSPSTSYANINTTNTAANTTINGQSYATFNSNSSTACPGTTPRPATTNTPGTFYDTTNSTSTTAPVHPGGTVTTTNMPYGTYTRTLPHTVFFYRYNRNAISGTTRCRLQVATATYDKTAAGTSTRTVNWTQYTDTFTNWAYQPVTHSIGTLKAGGSNWNTTVSLPISSSNITLTVSGSNSSQTFKRVANTNVTWDKCVEERETVRTTDFDPIPTAAKDLNIDLIPTGDATTRWAPILRDAVWGRYDGSGHTIATVTTPNDLFREIGTNCPAASRLATAWATPAAFDAYVTGLTASGSTYHDIGLIWGARLLSPTGMFATHNTNRQNIQRHLVFMTDGDTSTFERNYSAYGAEFWDRRRTSISSAPDSTILNEQVNLRFLAMCEYIKNEMGITLWVVAFGQGVSQAAKDNMEICASTGKYSDAGSNASLVSTFQGIADEISDLRLTS